MTFNQLFNYVDLLYSEDFEGLPERDHFTEEQWNLMVDIQKPYLLLTYPGYIR